MSMTGWAGGCLALSVLLSPTLALAQGPPAPNAVVASNGFYFWGDGSYQHVRLPRFALGAHLTDIVNVPNDYGFVQGFHPRLDGAAGTGGLGFSLPFGTFPQGFESVRVELNGGAMHATESQAATTVAGDNVFQVLDGTISGGTACGGPCNYATSLSTNYDAWHVGLNLTGDVRMGAVSLLPSFEILGGGTHVRQHFFQQRFTATTTTYDANTTLRWRDAGAKVGLGVAVPVAPAVAVTVGGTLAMMQRRASLSGSDMIDDTGGGVLNVSLIDVSRTAFAFVPGGQIQIVTQPFAMVQVRAFAGIEWDSRVPGIVGPSFTADQVNAGAPGNPAAIGFSGQTSYRVGGAIAVGFGPDNRR